MDDAFKFVRTTLLVIIAVLLVLAAFVGLIAVFTVNADLPPTGYTNAPSSTLNVYKTAEKNVVPQQKAPVYNNNIGKKLNVESSTPTYNPQEARRLNVQTTVNVRVNSGSSYYPRSRNRYHYPSRSYKYNAYRPYGSYYGSHNRYSYGSSYNHYSYNYPSYRSYNRIPSYHVQVSRW